MKRYRIWEANREVFLYPENWLIESQRPNRTEIYREARAGGPAGRRARPTTWRRSCSTTSTGSTTSPTCIVTGTCEDPKTGTIHVVAPHAGRPAARSTTGPTRMAPGRVGRRSRSTSRPTRSSRRSTGVGCACSGSRSRSPNEPRQPLPAAQQSSSAAAPGRREVRHDRASTSASTATARWAPGQTAKGKLFDKPFPRFGDTSGLRRGEDPGQSRRLYTLKVQSPAPAPRLRREHCSSTCSGWASCRRQELCFEHRPLNSVRGRLLRSRCTSAERASTVASRPGAAPAAGSGRALRRIGRAGSVRGGATR